MEDDYKKFCMNCGWNDCDYGCTCPTNERVYQCDMYIHYHPEEVEVFERSMEEWVRSMEHKKEGE